ncbi:hypothetical protein NIES2104_22670 [Leptolyngbya sp. NIES-2104]|nr:hypothetical protein NIES2104_22670 [Leptolyngbya sp. NIES-2104]
MICAIVAIALIRICHVEFLNNLIALECCNKNVSLATVDALMQSN